MAFSAYSPRGLFSDANVVSVSASHRTHVHFTILTMEIAPLKGE